MYPSRCCFSKIFIGVSVVDQVELLSKIALRLILFGFFRRSDPTTCQSRSTAAVASKQAAVPPTNSLSEDECKQCQTNQLTGWSYDEICASNHTHCKSIIQGLNLATSLQYCDLN